PAARGGGEGRSSRDTAAGKADLRGVTGGGARQGERRRGRGHRRRDRVLVDGRQAFQEIPQLVFGHRQSVLLQERDDVVVLELERHPKLLQYSVVGDGNLDGLGRSALVLAALVDDEAIQKVRHRLVAAGLVAVLVVCLEEGHDLSAADHAVAEPEGQRRRRRQDLQGGAQPPSGETVTLPHEAVQLSRSV